MQRVTSEPGFACASDSDLFGCAPSLPARPGGMESAREVLRPRALRDLPTVPDSCERLTGSGQRIPGSENEIPCPDRRTALDFETQSGRTAMRTISASLLRPVLVLA